MNPYIVKILLVDNRSANLDRLITYLTNADFQIFIAENGQNALECLDYLLPDLILLELNLPDMSGFAVCQALKANPQTSNIPIIVLSVRSETEDKLKCFALGAVDYMTKPLVEAEVVARVRIHLQLMQTYRALREENYKLQQRIIAQATTGKPCYALPTLLPTNGRPLLELTLLDTFQLVIGGEVRADFRSDMVRALLAYLVLEGQLPLERAQLAKFFWPSYLPHTRLNSLRVALHNLRQLLTPLAGLLVTSRKHVQFRVDPAYVWCDALALATGSTTGCFDPSGLKPLAPANGVPAFLTELATVDSAPFQHWRRQKQALYTPHGLWTEE